MGKVIPFQNKKADTIYVRLIVEDEVEGDMEIIQPISRQSLPISVQELKEDFKEMFIDCCKEELSLKCKLWSKRGD